MADLFGDPMGIEGFEFVEFASPTPGVIEPMLETMGFAEVDGHRSKDVALYRQGDINFVVNREPRSVAGYFVAEHGPSACGLAFRVRDAHAAYDRPLAFRYPPRRSCVRRKRRPPVAVDNPASQSINPQPIH